MTDAAALWPTANPSPFSPFVSPAGRQAVPRSHSASHRATPGLASLARGDEISAAPIPSPGWAREALRSLFGHDLYRKTGSHFCGIMHLIHPARGGAGSREAGPYVSVQPLGCPRAAIFWRRLHNPFFAHGTAMRAGFASTSAPFPPSPQSRLRAISRIGLRSGDDPGPLANTPAAPRNPRESRAAGQHFRTRGLTWAGPATMGIPAAWWAKPQPLGLGPLLPPRMWPASRQGHRTRTYPGTAILPHMAKSVLSPAPLRGSDCGGV